MEEVANINAVSNIPERIRREEISSDNWKTLLQLRRRAATICHDDISDTYISAVFNKLKTHAIKGFIYFDQNDIAIGFIIYEIHIVPANHLSNIERHRYAFIHLLCALENKEHIGSGILQNFEKYCRPKGCVYIKLEPTNQRAANFYFKNGYRSTVTELGKYGQLQMSKSLEPLLLRRKGLTAAELAVAKAPQRLKFDLTSSAFNEFNAKVIELYNALPK